MKISQRNKGILCIFGAAFFFSCMSAAVRGAGDIPLFEKAFFRNAVAALIAYIAIIKDGCGIYVGKNARLDILLRAGFGTLGIFTNFYALSTLPLSDANMLNKLSPFWAILFSIFLLRERVRPKQLLMLAGALVGAVLIVRPTGSNISLIPGLSGLAGGAFAGLAYTFVRRLSKKNVNGKIIVLYFSVLSSLASLLAVIVYGFVMLDPMQLACLLLCGIFAAGGQFCITAAYSYAPAKEISIYDYSQVIFSAVLGFVLFSQVPDRLSILGYVIITAMGILNFSYNRRADA